MDQRERAGGRVGDSLLLRRLDLRLDAGTGGDVTVRGAMFDEPVRVHRNGRVVPHRVDGAELTATRGASYRIVPG